MTNIRTLAESFWFFAILALVIFTYALGSTGKIRAGEAGVLQGLGDDLLRARGSVGSQIREMADFD